MKNFWLIGFFLFSTQILFCVSNDSITIFACDDIDQAVLEKIISKLDNDPMLLKNNKDSLRNVLKMDTNIVFENRETEAFYAAKNFREKVLLCIKVTVVICVVVGLGYLFYWYFGENENHPWWMSFPFFSSAPKQPERTSQQDAVNQDQHTNPAQEHSLSTAKDANHVASGNLNVHSDEAAKSSLETPDSINQTNDNAVIGFFIENNDLTDRLADQIRQAHERGLDPSRQEWDSHALTRAPLRDDRKFDQLIGEQITYAQLIGLATDGVPNVVRLQ